MIGGSTGLTVHWSRAANRHLVFLSTMLLLALVVGAAGAPMLAPHDPEYIDLLAKSVPPGNQYALGTDRLGRDVLSRLLWGGRLSLAVSISAACVATVVGLCVGAVSGYAGGTVDNVVARMIDLALAMPTFFLLVAVQSVLAPGVASVILVIGLTSWMSLARIARAQVLSLRSRDFVAAARSLGCSPARVLIRHIAPNLAGQVIVFFSLVLADALLIEAALSFLGLGVPPYQPSWGNMLIDGQVSILAGSWWIALFPGLVILVTALSFNTLGDAIQQAWSR